MSHRGPFQPLPFCDSVNSVEMTRNTLGSTANSSSMSDKIGSSLWLSFVPLDFLEVDVSLNSSAVACFSESSTSRGRLSGNFGGSSSVLCDRGGVFWLMGFLVHSTLPILIFCLGKIFWSPTSHASF